jgi:hypothetical protein
VPNDPKGCKIGTVSWRLPSTELTDSASAFSDDEQTQENDREPGEQRAEPLGGVQAQHDADPDGNDRVTELRAPRLKADQVQRVPSPDDARGSSP